MNLDTFWTTVPTRACAERTTDALVACRPHAVPVGPLTLAQTKVQHSDAARTCATLCTYAVAEGHNGKPYADASVALAHAGRVL